MNATNKTDYIELESQIESLVEYRELIDTLLRRINEKIQTVISEETDHLGRTLFDLVNAYNDEHANATEIVDDVCYKIGSEIEGRSERWIESDKGQETTEWQDDWSLLQSLLFSSSEIEINIQSNLNDEDCPIELELEELSESLYLPPRQC